MLIKAGEFKRILSFVYHSLDPPLQPPTKNFLYLPCLAGKVDPNCMGLQVTWTLSFLWLTQLILVTFWQVPDKPVFHIHLDTEHKKS